MMFIELPHMTHCWGKKKKKKTFGGTGICLEFVRYSCPSIFDMTEVVFVLWQLIKKYKMSMQ